MAQTAKTKHTYEAVRAGAFNHRARLLHYRLRASDKTCPPFFDPFERQAAGKIREALCKPREIVGCNRLLAPDVVGGQLPEARDLGPGFGPRPRVRVGHIDLAYHDRVAAGWISESRALCAVRLNGAGTVGQRLARKRQIPAPARHDGGALRRGRTVI